MKILLIILLNFSIAQAKSSFIPARFKANFQQIYKSAVSGKVKRRSGSISYKYPGNIRLEMTPPPVKTIFVSNSRTSWYYTAPFIDGEKGDVIISNSGDKEFVKIFDILKLGLKDNQKYKVDIKGDLANIKFSSKTARLLEATKTTIKFKSAKIRTFNNIRWIKFYYVNKRPVQMVFSSLAVNPSFGNSTFLFTPPKNTNISRE